MPIINDPGQLTADERLDEIAAILALGCLRCEDHATVATEARKSAESSQNLPESGSQGLDVSEETRLSVHAG